MEERVPGKVLAFVRSERIGGLAALLLPVAVGVAYLALAMVLMLGLCELIDVLVEAYRFQPQAFRLAMQVGYITAVSNGSLALLRLCRGEREWNNLFLDRELAKLQSGQAPRCWYRRLFSELPGEALRDWRAGRKARASVA